MTEREFTAVYQQDGKWYPAPAEELPGAFGQGRTIAEAREDLKAAVALLLEDDRERAEADELREVCLRESIGVSIP